MKTVNDYVTTNVTTLLTKPTIMKAYILKE